MIATRRNPNDGSWAFFRFAPLPRPLDIRWNCHRSISVGAAHMIEVSGLAFTYPGAGAPAVEGLSFDVAKGEVFRPAEQTRSKVYQ